MIQVLLPLAPDMVLVLAPPTRFWILLKANDDVPVPPTVPMLVPLTLKFCGLPLLTLKVLLPLVPPATFKLLVFNAPFKLKYSLLLLPPMSRRLNGPVLATPFKRDIVTLPEPVVCNVALEPN